jgi:hypothetical protein
MPRSKYFLNHGNNRKYKGVSASLPPSQIAQHFRLLRPPVLAALTSAATVLRLTYFVSAGGTDGLDCWSLRCFFSSFLAFFSRSLFRFSN